MCAWPGVNYGLAVIGLQRWRLIRDDWRTHRSRDIEPHDVTGCRRVLSIAAD